VAPVTWSPCSQVLDDGSLTSPCQTFEALHAGGDSDDEALAPPAA